MNKKLKIFIYFGIITLIITSIVIVINLLSDISIITPFIMIIWIFIIIINIDTIMRLKNFK